MLGAVHTPAVAVFCCCSTKAHVLDKSSAEVGQRNPHCEMTPTVTRRAKSDTSKDFEGPAAATCVQQRHNGARTNQVSVAAR
eukprot:366009-Chlamydomonas_euryale.AAC.37